MTTRRRTAPIATVNRPIWISEATLSQVRAPLAAETAASTTASAESSTAARTWVVRALELVSETTEVALVARISITADQPRLESREART